MITEFTDLLDFIKSFSEHAEFLDEVPTDDLLVLDVIEEFVDSQTDLSKAGLRGRSWYVLPWVEGALTDWGRWLDDALQGRGVEHLLVISTEREDDGHPLWAGWVPATPDGRRFLDDAASVSTFLVTDRKRQFCWLQAWTDAFLLAGDLDFITDVQGSTFGTALDLSLNNAGAFSEKHCEQWGVDKCRKYEEFFPPPATCDVPTLDDHSFRRLIEPARLDPPPIPASATEMRNGIRVFSTAHLKQRGWLALPLRTGFGKDWFAFSTRAEVQLYAAAEAERLATAIAQLGHEQTRLYRVDEAEDTATFVVETTRDGILGAVDLAWDHDILLTSSEGDFAALGSAGEFFLVAGPAQFVRTAAGGDISRYLDFFDTELSRLSERAPQVADVLTDTLLEYFDALEYDTGASHG